MSMTPDQLQQLASNTRLVVVDDDNSYFDLGQIIYRWHKYGDDDQSVWCSSQPDNKGDGEFMATEEVELYVEPRVSGEVGCASPGVYRPVLEERKLGKIRVELVDEGFPLALREVANVMTWAQTAKGYKDHDWQNLPNAEIALAAAASRHRTDHIKQRVVDDLAIVQCVDGESGLLHKAHEAFGVLAQLELMLRGKFVDSRPQIGV